MAMTDEQFEALGEQVANLSERLGEMTNALGQMVQVQSQFIQAATGTKIKLDGLSSSADGAGAALKNKAKIEQEIAEEVKKREAAIESAEKNAIRSLASFGDALFSTEKGFGKFSGSLGSAGDAAFELGKSFGLLGTVIGAIIKVGTSVGEMFLKQADAQNNFVTEVYKMGGISGQSSEKLTDLAREAGYSAGELDKLTPSLKAAGRGLATLGTSTGDGTTSLLKLFNVGNDLEKEFFRIGYSLEELNKTQADYIELQRISGVNLRARGVDEDKLKKQSLDYAKNLRELSDLTGKSAETLQQEQAAAQSAYENVVANRQDEAKIRQLQTEAANETNQERKAQLEREIAELENAGRVRNEAIGAMAGTLGKDFGEQFGRILRTGTFDELTGPLANLFSQSGLDPADIKSRFEGVEAGSEEFKALVADIQGNLRSGIDSSILMLGDSIQYGGEEMGRAFGLARQLIEDSAVIDPSGEIQQARARAIQSEIDSTMAAGDAQRDYAAATETFTRDMRVTADAMLDAMNPLTGEMDLLKGSMTALAVAVAAATLALGAMALGKGVSAIRNASRRGGPRSGPGSTPDGNQPRARDARGRFTANVADDITDTARTGSGVSRFTGNVARRLPGAGAVISGGMAVYGGFQENQDINRQLEAGEITQAEATRAKTVNISSTAGETLGGAGGAFAGAATGAAIGSVVPVVGTIIGGLIGAAVGGWLGSEAGEVVGESLGETINVTREAMDNDTTSTPDVPSARESRIAAEREDRNRRIQLAREGHSRSEIEAMMVSSREQSLPDSESIPTARAPEETPNEIAAAITPPEVSTARPLEELMTADDFTEERNKLDQLVQQNEITRQEQLDLLGELRNRERELAETAYQERQTTLRTPEPVIETPTPDQVTAAITPAPVTPNTQTTTPGVTTPTQPAANTEINDVMSMLTYKLDAMIALLDTGVTIQDRILLESRS